MARLRLFGHVMRMADDRYPKVVVEDSFEGHATRAGRPEKTWVHCIKTDLEMRGTGLYSARHLARKSWSSYRKRIVFGDRSF